MENQHLRGGRGKTVKRPSHRVQTTTWGFKSVQGNSQTFLQIHGTLHPSTQQVYTPTEKRRSPPGWQRFRLNHHTPSICKKASKGGVQQGLVGNHWMRNDKINIT